MAKVLVIPPLAAQALPRTPGTSSRTNPPRVSLQGSNGQGSSGSASEVPRRFRPPKWRTTGATGCNSQETPDRAKVDMLADVTHTASQGCDCIDCPADILLNCDPAREKLARSGINLHPQKATHTRVLPPADYARTARERLLVVSVNGTVSVSFLGEFPVKPEQVKKKNKGTRPQVVLRGGNTNAPASTPLIPVPPSLQHSPVFTLLRVKQRHPTKKQSLILAKRRAKTSEKRKAALRRAGQLGCSCETLLRPKFHRGDWTSASKKLTERCAALFISALIAHRDRVAEQEELAYLTEAGINRDHLLELAAEAMAEAYPSEAELKAEWEAFRFPKPKVMPLLRTSLSELYERYASDATDPDEEREKDEMSYRTWWESARK